MTRTIRTTTRTYRPAQTIVINVGRGDEIVVYAYTGTWLADFPMITTPKVWPSQAQRDRVQPVRKQIEEGITEEPVMAVNWSSMVA